MGARITAEGPKGTAPLVIEGAKPHPIQYFMPVASAQVKSAILLAGPLRQRQNDITEPNQSRDHTERMLGYFLVRPQRDDLSVSIFGRADARIAGLHRAGGYLQRRVLAGGRGRAAAAPICW